MIKVKCDQCGKEIRKIPSQVFKHNFCSRDCWNNWQRVDLKKIVCTNCGKKLKLYPCRVHKHNFCSRQCTNHWQRTHFRIRPKEAICQRCKNLFEPQTIKQKFCNINCRYGWSGEKRKLSTKNDFWCWLAGFFDGEGHFAAGNRLTEIGFSNTDKSTIEFIAKNLGRKFREDKRTNKKHRVKFSVQITRQDEIITVLKRMSPFLITKRKRALLALKYLESRQKHPLKKGFPRSYASITKKENELLKEIRNLNR